MEFGRKSITMIEFEKILKIDIESSIGKIPKRDYFFKSVMDIFRKLDFKILELSSNKLVYAMCGSGLYCHTAYTVLVKWNNHQLSITNHYDKLNNPEVQFIDCNGSIYTNLKTWDCMFGEPFKLSGQYIHLDDLLKLINSSC